MRDSDDSLQDDLSWKLPFDAECKFCNKSSMMQAKSIWHTTRDVGDQIAGLEACEPLASLQEQPLAIGNGGQIH